MLGVIAAMQNEADIVLKHCTAVRRAQLFGRTVWHAELYNKDILLVLSGVGKTNAAASAMLALSQGADKLLNVGVAGGLAPQAKIGSVVRIARAVQSDFDLSVINGTSVGTLKTKPPTFPRQTSKVRGMPPARSRAQTISAAARTERSNRRSGRRCATWRARRSHTLPTARACRGRCTRRSRTTRERTARANTRKISRSRWTR